MNQGSVGSLDRGEGIVGLDGGVCRMREACESYVRVLYSVEVKEKNQQKM